MPSLKLSRSTGIIEVWDWDINGTAGTAGIESAPIVIANDLTEEMLASYRIFVEMLVYRRGKKGNNPGPTNYVNEGTQSSGYIVPSPWFPVDTPPNTAPYFPWQAAGGFWSRTGDHVWQDHGTTSGLVSVDRPNHYEVTAVNQRIPVWEYLNGRFTLDKVQYRSSTSGNVEDNYNMLVPVSRRRQPNISTFSRFPYSARYAPLYAAFRYIAWDPSANGGLGQIMSGPLSKTIKVSHKRFPWEYDWAASGTYGIACCTPLWFGTSGVNIVDGANSVLKCWIETRLP